MGGPDGINDGDGDGVDVDLEATIDNFGLIQGTGAGGHGSDGLPNTSEGIAAGGGTITNHSGATIIGAGLGILIDDSSQGNAPFLTEIINDGTITGTAGFAIRIISALDDTITNNGTISGGAGVAIQFGSGANTLSIGNNSIITGTTQGGLGTDTLDYSGRTSSGVTVNIGTGAATGTGGVESFERVIGTTFADTLTGGASSDSLSGGLGNDTYIVGLNDSIVESAASSGGVDTVKSSTTSINLTKASYLNVEDVTLLGSSGLSATGCAGANVLAGSSNSAANALIGGAGNDTYIVGSNDSIVEQSTTVGGVDIVKSSATSINLTNASYLNVENIALLGDAGLSGIGSAADNRIIGNSGANLLNGAAGADTLHGGAGSDTLNGGLGNDALVGGAGADIFVFSTSLSSNIDRITDFVIADDTIRLENSVFTALASTGALDSAFFRIGTAALDANDRIIYNAVTGALIYDNNGSAAGGAVQFATLTTHPAGLTAADFVII